jgi:GGDEF domain-containing protein
VTPPANGAAAEPAVDHVLRTGAVGTSLLGAVLPLTGSGGVFGAVTVTRPRRAVESFVASMLQILGAQCGAALERLRAVEHLLDAHFVDPITGVGNDLAATAALATLHAGDTVLLLAVDDLPAIRAADAGRADLVLGQLGLHLRTATRAGDVVAHRRDGAFFVLLRDLDTASDDVVTRLVASCGSTIGTGPLRAGAARHLSGATSTETLDRAIAALDAGRVLDLSDDARRVSEPVAPRSDHPAR